MIDMKVFILGLPILLLLISIVCCIACIWLASGNRGQIERRTRRIVRRGAVDRAKRRNRRKVYMVHLQERIQDGIHWLVFECLLYAIAFLLPFVFGLFKSNFFAFEISTRDVMLAVFAVSINLVSYSKIILIDNLEQSETPNAFFSKKFSVIIFSIFLWSMVVLGFAILSKDIFERFLLAERFLSDEGFLLAEGFLPIGVFQISFGIVSFLLIGSAVLTYTRKIIEHAEINE